VSSLKKKKIAKENLQEAYSPVKYGHIVET